MLTGIPGGSGLAVLERFWEICRPVDNSGPPALCHSAPLPAVCLSCPTDKAFDPYLPQNYHCSSPSLLFKEVGYVALWLTYLCPQFICVLNVTVSFLLKAEAHTVVVSFPVAMIKSLTKAI